MIDGTSIRAHRHAAGALGGQDRQFLGRSSGDFSSKIHTKVDSFGMLLNILITAGQTAEITQVQAFIGKDLCRNILAGRGYDSNNLRHMLAEMNIDRMIPGRKNRIEPIEYDRHSYKERNAIKRFFGRLKEYRRIATRYDKTEIMLKARVVLGCIFMWLKV